MGKDISLSRLGVTDTGQDEEYIRRRHYQHYARNPLYPPRRLGEQVETEQTNWQVKAACRGQDTNRFYNDDVTHRVADLPDLRLLCATCPVRKPCLEYALAHNQPGVWGGTLVSERQAIRARRRQAGTS